MFHLAAKVQPSSLTADTTRSWRSKFSGASRNSSMLPSSKVQAGSRVVPFPESEMDRHIELVDMKQQQLDFEGEDEKKGLGLAV